MPVAEEDTRSTPVDAEQPSHPAATPARRAGRRADLYMAAFSLLGAAFVTSGLWAHPNHRVVAANRSDQALFEWLLAYAAHTLGHGGDPFWTHLLNAPDGVNLAVNTSITVLGVALMPVTLLLGPSIAFATALTVNLAASAYAGYWLFSRYLQVGPVAAAAGGFLFGFAPGVISHANAHLNFTAFFLLPVIIARVLALRRPGRALRNGVILGLLVAAQFSLGSELLFFTAIGCGVLLLVAIAAGHREPRPHLVAFGKAVGVTAMVAGALLAYPIWLQFFGAQSYHGTGFDQRIHAEDLQSYAAYAQRSLAALVNLDAPHLAANATEENSFFGLPLLLVTAAAAAMLLWRGPRSRRPLIWALLGTGAFFAVLSVGPRWKFGGHIYDDIPMPYAALAHLPLFDAALPARIALLVAPVLGALLALGLDAVRTVPTARLRLVAGVAVVVALLPILPTPLRAIPRSPVPLFISSGHWKAYVPPGQTMVPVPPPSDFFPDGQRWQAAALASGDGQVFKISAGFFLGPGGPDGVGRIGPVPRPTYAMLSEVALTGEVPVVTDTNRVEARDDLRFWGGRAVVLPDPALGAGTRWRDHHDALLTTVTALLGPGEHVDDVRVWRVPA